MYIYIYLLQTPEIGQGLGRFLSCGARKTEQTYMDLLIIVNSEPPPFFMTYSYFLRVVSRLRKTIYRRTGVRTHGHRCVRLTPYLLHHSRLQETLLFVFILLNFHNSRTSTIRTMFLFPWDLNYHSITYKHFGESSIKSIKSKDS